MALMEWLQKHLAGDEKAVLSKEEDSLSGLSLFESIATHKAWRQRLQATLDGIREDDVPLVARRILLVFRGHAHI